MAIDEHKKEESIRPNNGTGGQGCNLEAFRHRCRSSGLKITPQRLEIYKALMASKEHPTAESVYRTVKRYCLISLLIR
ncbi:MAG: transcriptional repressor [Planctomycetota bacterium]|nr:transcriptional repressor [Planctomycetota bacterium]